MLRYSTKMALEALSFVVGGEVSMVLVGRAMVHSRGGGDRRKQKEKGLKASSTLLSCFSQKVKTLAVLLLSKSPNKSNPPSKRMPLPLPYSPIERGGGG
ncbi:hypothetical protein SLE2022_237270 [Rubroshorea leprosula]